MISAIRKHLVDVAAVLVLVVVAVAVAGVVLTNQRLALPGWVPFIGQDFYEIQAEMSTAQAVTPGQGQTVNIAGVQVGEISEVRLQRGRAIVTLRMRPEHDRVYRNASVLLRPKTGLKDMVAELTPGTRDAGRLREGGTIPVSQTLPDVNFDEILASLDGDTRSYLQLLLSGGGEGLRGNGRALANAIRRIEPTARDLARIGTALEQRRGNLARVVHNFSLLTEELGNRDDELANFVQSSNAVFGTFADQDENLRATVRALPPALAETTAALDEVDRMAAELGPTLEALRPGARALGPSLQQTRPFLRTTTPVIRDEIRPFTRAALPLATEIRPAARDLAAATPELGRAFGVVNRVLNTLAHNPRGNEEGYLFWLSWLNHLGGTLFSTQDAQGPIRQGVITLGCSELSILGNVALGNPALGTLVGLLNAPKLADVCTPAAGG